MNDESRGQTLQLKVRASRHALDETLEERLSVRALSDLQRKLSALQRQAGALSAQFEAASRHPAPMTQWVREKPLEAIFVAFAAGIVLGATPFR
jgi:ElaB/YqjD/DUF883 family membrane-anchored ribosome-binding protein